MKTDKIIENMTLEEMVGQLFCYDIYDSDDPKKIEEILKKVKVGGIFVQRMPAEKIKLYTDMAQKYTDIPVIVSADVENGPGNAVKGTPDLPYQMAWGAADDVELVEKIGYYTGKICRQNGVHWTFSPVVDINYNFQSADVNVRAISDSPDHVVKIASAIIKGMQKDGNMVVTCKHFPGGGVDERNSHFLTSINYLSKEEWMATYGKIYKEMIKLGVPAIMAGHTALPAYEKDVDEFYGYPPCVFSKSLMTDLLKGELGFDGCIVSDAMSMIGASAMVDDLKDIAVKFIEAGGDMVLFPEPTDYDAILQAVKSGRISIERIKDAVSRILTLKERAGLFSSRENGPHEDFEKISYYGQKLADKSITVVRDVKNILPIKLKEHSKILMLTMIEPHFQRKPTGEEFRPMIEEFEKNGHSVTQIVTAKHKEVKEIMDDYDAVLLNCRMSSLDYHGATMRIGWNNIMVLWRAYVLQHPKFVFTSFGDPYKLYDAPYLKTYINAYSDSPYSQRAVAKVIMGQIKPEGKNPVELKGFFKREV